MLVNKKVLVAEDNAINQMVVKHTLIKLGATADITGDGAEAIEKFKHADYDLVLMDIQMPLMDGYETTAYIRNQLKSNVPIIAMTAFALNGEDEKCFESGMNGYVSKPFTVDSLGAAIEKVLAAAPQVNSNPYILGNKNLTIDLSFLYDISGNDESYINTMIQTFLENMPASIKKVDDDLEARDWDALYKSAHYAKSSLSVVKINEVYDAIIEIEKNALHKTNLHLLPELVKTVKEKYVLAEKILSQKFGAACNSY